MSEPIFGKNASVKIGSTTVANMAEYTINSSRDITKECVFGVDSKLITSQSPPDWSGSISGFLDKTDTAGQTLLENTLASGTGIADFRLYIDDTNYYAPDTASLATATVYLTGQGVTASCGDSVKVNFDFTVNGALKRN